MLYTCAKEFDFLGTEMPLKATKTLLIPAAIAACLLFIHEYFFSFVSAVFTDELADTPPADKTESSSSTSNKKKDATAVAEVKAPAVDPAVFYNLIQMVVYAVMAIMIMRLKLFWSPQLCIVSGLVASEKVREEISLYCNVFQEIARKCQSPALRRKFLKIAPHSPNLLILFCWLRSIIDPTQCSLGRQVKA